MSKIDTAIRYSNI